MPQTVEADAPAGLGRQIPRDRLRVVLRLENLALAIAAVIAFHAIGGGWGLFAILILLPDLSMLGYLAGPSVGAGGYNVGHSYVGPALLAALGWALGHPLLQQIALVWCAHIGGDRALGFGLKYPTGFGDTHLGRLARRAGGG